jgi:sialate O-acetylesterase
MKRITLALSTLLLAVCPTFAAVTLSPLFSDHMVLQRGMNAPMWGKASPGEKVTVEIAGKTATATADDKGDWQMKLPPLNKGDATTLTITDGDGKKTVIKDVLIGDVWICSGQSNMDFPVRLSNQGGEEVKNARHPNIRFFQVPHVPSIEPSKALKGEWKVCSPDTVENLTAVGYFFGRDLSEMEDVPVGLIQNAWGGMPAEAFTTRQTLEADPDFKPLVDLKLAAKNGYPEKKAKHEKELKAWQEKHFAKDPGNKGEGQGFAKADFDDSSWKTMDEPTKWEKKGLDIDGAVWFRKTVEIPQSWADKPLMLSLGVLDDFDITYFNGDKVGAIGPENPFAWAAARKYDVPANLVKPGKAVIATRIFDRYQEGGFNEPADALKLTLKDGAGSESMPLAGEWKYEVEYAAKPSTDKTPAPAAPFAPDSPSAASNLFNGQVNPVIPYAIKGAIWFQGESNADRAWQYRKLFPAMIADWRREWGQGDFPFLFVQLANFSMWKPRPAEPADSNWAELREAQTMTLNKSPNTGMAVTIDIGDSADIHPRNKQDVGKRLALAAEKVAYGKSDVEFSGPMYKAMKLEGDAIRVSFDHADGLTARGGEPKGFEIAGEDKKFHWATARIEGSDVVVRSDQVKAPVAVRYGWQDDPVVNLFNAAGLPASPFRTDDWEMATQGVLVPGGKKR